jgi:hypothetical protein
MITEYFKKQIEAGTEIFFYGLERGAEQDGSIVASIMRHRGSLDNFPTNLEFVSMMTENTPLFKETK